MTWKIKAWFLVIMLTPSFTGYPVNIFDSHIAFGWSEGLSSDGPTDGQLLYLVISILAISLICGLRIMQLGLTTGALISLSIVFAGGLVAFIRTKVGLTDSSSEFQYSAYYISRLVNIITVVPLALSLFLTIPFLQFERSILASNKGVSIKQKIQLMVVRVINNIRYSVLPNLWSVLTEERLNKDGDKEVGVFINEAIDGKDATLRKKLKKFIATNLYIAASGIASSLEYVPLWAVEISRLPNKQKREE